MQINLTVEEFKKLWNSPVTTLKEIQEITGLSSYILKRQAKLYGLSNKQRRRGRPLKMGE